MAPRQRRRQAEVQLRRVREPMAHEVAERRQLRRVAQRERQREAEEGASAMVTETDPTWDSNKQLIAGLYPNFHPTDEERQLFAKALAHRDQQHVRDAIEHERMTAESDYKPHIGR